jgi:hypothetical protein
MQEECSQFNITRNGRNAIKYSNMTPKFNKLYQTLLEYFVDNAKAYYIDGFGNISPVENSHYQQIIEDYDLDSVMQKTFKQMYDEYLDYDDDSEWCNEFVREFMADSRIFAIVHDLTRKIVFVRAPKNSLNADQRKSIMEFCFKKNSELEYDTKVFA